MHHYTKEEQTIIEHAIQFLSTAFSSVANLDKPVLLHSIRVGTTLYKRGYNPRVVIAGYLHDVMEDTEHAGDDISRLFGEEASSLVAANTKNTSLVNRDERHKELIARCFAHSEDAAIIKAADILDNYEYYAALDESKGIDYCIGNAALAKEYLPSSYSNEIFAELFALIPQA